MPFHLEKKHWVWVGVAVAGVAGLYLLMHRGSGSGSAADAGLPITGPPQLGNQTPNGANTPSSLTAGEDVAQQLSSRMLYMQQATANQASNLQSIAATEGGTFRYGTGVVSKAWQQVQGGWEDIYHPGNIISDQEAQSLAPQNHGPFAKGGGGFFAQIGTFIENNVKQAAQIYAASQGVPVVPIAGGGNTGTNWWNSPVFGSSSNTPRPSQAPAYGNPPNPTGIKSGGITVHFDG